MAGAVMIAQQYWIVPDTFRGSVVNLVISAGVGAAVYCGTILLLWRLDPRPDSAEAFVVRRAKIVTDATGSRFRAWWHR
jgi:hypothetical protein